MLRLVFMACLLVGSSLHSQTFPGYKKADDFAMGLKFPVQDRLALDSLVRMVDRQFNTREEKIRAIFTWIATHLEYDCGNDSVPALRSTSIDQVLRTGRSQCAGYSNLLQYTLRQLGFEVVTIKGVAKTAKKDLLWRAGDLRPNHSWNAVKLDGQWKLLDPTWASGAADDDCLTVTREFSPFYFFPDPEKFILSHLPSDSGWQLIREQMTPAMFLSIPVFHDPYYEHGVKTFSPVSGVLKVKKNEMVTFEFTSSTPLERIAIWSEDNKTLKPEFGNFSRNGEKYTYSYRVTLPGSYFLNISLDGKRTAMVYYIQAAT